jgi:hypothetical protein
MCVEGHKRQSITCNIDDTLTWIEDQSSSLETCGWTSWPAHCEWNIINLFTGYRIREYRQTYNCTFGNCVSGPMCSGSGEFYGTPLAACHTYFFLFDFFSKKVPHMNKLNCIGLIEVCLRWQKSLRHGQFFTFKAIPGDPLCQVALSRRSPRRHARHR